MRFGQRFCHCWEHFLNESIGILLRRFVVLSVMLSVSNLFPDNVHNPISRHLWWYLPWNSDPFLLPKGVCWRQASGVASARWKELRRNAPHVQILCEKARHIPQGIRTSAEISRAVNRHLHKVINSRTRVTESSFLLADGFPYRGSSSTEFLPTVSLRTSVLSRGDYRTAQMKRTVVWVSVHTGDYWILVMRSQHFISVATWLSLNHCLCKRTAETYALALTTIVSFSLCEMFLLSLLAELKIKLNDGQKNRAKWKCWSSWKKPKCSVSATVRTVFHCIDFFSFYLLIWFPIIKLRTKSQIRNTRTVNSRRL